MGNADNNDKTGAIALALAIVLASVGGLLLKFGGGWKRDVNLWICLAFLVASYLGVIIGARGLKSTQLRQRQFGGLAIPVHVSVMFCSAIGVLGNLLAVPYF
jgi:hypothetical protein